MKKILCITLILCLLVGIAVVTGLVPIQTTYAAAPAPTPWWNFQSIDTMKFSRDPSRQFLSDPDSLKQTAEQQVKLIAGTGATYVAIATPYDDEFSPVLKEWVAVARKYNLHVWFRGNWSGWEGWFGYSSITRDQHIQKTLAFIKQNPDLFQDGDIFSACPECENGGPGDPRQTGDVDGYRQFLISEYQQMGGAFRSIDKNVQINFNSMNGDVARLIMDKPTTQALGGLVVVDHYVETPAELDRDITDFAERSGGRVVLGEFGAPIPDIHGQMTNDQQAEWIKQTMTLLASNPHVYGMNYWTGMGGSTSIWNDNGIAKPAVKVLESFYMPPTVTGVITDTLGNRLDAVLVRTSAKTTTVQNGNYTLAYLDSQSPVSISADGYADQQTTVTALKSQPNIQLVPSKQDLWYRFQVWVHHFFAK